MWVRHPGQKVVLELEIIRIVQRVKLCKRSSRDIKDVEIKDCKIDSKDRGPVIQLQASRAAPPS